MAIDPEVRTYLFYGAMVFAAFVLLLLLSKKGENLNTGAQQVANPNTLPASKPLTRPLANSDNTQGGLPTTWKPAVGPVPHGTQPSFKSGPGVGAGGVVYGGLVAAPTTGAGASAAYKGATAANGGPVSTQPNTNKAHKQYMNGLNKQLAAANSTLEDTNVTWWTRDYGVRQLNNGERGAYLDPTKAGYGHGTSGKGALPGAGGGNAGVQRLASTAGLGKDASVGTIQAFASAYHEQISVAQKH